MELNIVISGVYFDTMNENQKKQFYDDFYGAIGVFSGDAITPSTIPAMKHALIPFMEKYNLKEENIDFAWL